MLSLHSLVYVSVATRPFSPEELESLLAQSRERNRQEGITGMLLYKSGCFMQAIEGDADAIRNLHRRIERDPRHRNVLVLQDLAIEVRNFSGWTMGFKNLDEEPLEKQSGFGEMMKGLLRHGRNSVEISRVIKLLRSFT